MSKFHCLTLSTHRTLNKNLYDTKHTEYNFLIFFFGNFSHKAEDTEPVYDTVDNTAAPAKPTAAQRTRPPRLDRQSAIDQNELLSTAMQDVAVRMSQRNVDEDENRRRTQYIRPAPSFPPPPPPASSPPHSPILNTTHTELAVDILRNMPMVETAHGSESPINTHPMGAHQNSPVLEPNKRFAHNSPLNSTQLTTPSSLIRQENLDLRDSIDEYNDELGDIILRLREFKDFSTRSNRGSSKNVCSLISVSYRDVMW